MAVFPVARASARIPPVDVPTSQSKLWMIGLPNNRSKESNILVKTRPFIPRNKIRIILCG